MIKSPMGLLNKSTYSKVLISVVGLAAIGVFSVSFFNPEYFQDLYTNTVGQVKKNNYKAPSSKISLKIEGSNFQELYLSSFSWEKKSKNKNDPKNLIVSLASAAESAELFSTASSGKHFKSATLSQVQPGGLIYQWKLYDLTINSYKIGSEENNAYLMDYVEFVPKKVSFTLVNPAKEVQQNNDVQVDQNNQVQENIQVDQNNQVQENIQTNPNNEVIQDTSPVNAVDSIPASGGTTTSTDSLTPASGGTTTSPDGGGPIDTSPQF